ncbi:PsbP domain-containing protein 5, chloroplastic, partial [Ananas comosus]
NKNKNKNKNKKMPASGEIPSRCFFVLFRAYFNNDELTEEKGSRVCEEIGSELLCIRASDELKLHAVVELDEDVKMALLLDDINAYSFLVSPESRKILICCTLSPDARQRIVSERVDMINNLVISVSVGPLNSRFLTSNDKVLESKRCC